MSDLVKGASPKEIADFLGQKFGKKRQDRSVAKLEKYPVAGYFSRVGTATATIDGNEIEFPCVYIADGSGKNAKEIGKISFASIHRFIYAGKTQKVAKKGKYEGKYMLATKPLHDFSVNKSESEVISAILGKQYTAADKMVELALVDYDKPTDTVLSICDKEEDCGKFIAAKDVCFITLK